MKRSRFTEDQIIGILKEHEAGISVADLCGNASGVKAIAPAPRGSLIHNGEFAGMALHGFFVISLRRSAACAEPSNCSSARLASTGVWFSRDECGLTLLSSYRQSASLQRASSNISKISSFSSSSLRLPLKLSMKAFWVRLARVDVMPVHVVIASPL